MVGLLLCVVESCVLGLAVAPAAWYNGKNGGRDNQHTTDQIFSDRSEMSEFYRGSKIAVYFTAGIEPADICTGK